MNIDYVNLRLFYDYLEKQLYSLLDICLDQFDPLEIYSLRYYKQLMIITAK